MSKKYWESYYNALKKQDWEEAKNSLEQISKTEKDNAQVLLKLGDVYQRMNDTARAISTYHKSAWILKNQGFIQKSLALYKIILRLDSGNDEALKLSKELMFEIDKAKSQRPSAPYFEPQQVIGYKLEEEKGMPIDFEDVIEEEVKPEVVSPETAKQTTEFEERVSSKIEDLIERTSYSEETISPSTELPESVQTSTVEQKEKIDDKQGLKEPITKIPYIFTSLSPDEIMQIMNRVELHTYSPGQIILEEGDSGDSIFFINSGHAKVVAHMLGKEIELAILSAGDVFGEVAFLTGRPRTASVIAMDKIEVFELNKVILDGIFEKYPDILKRLDDFYQCRVQDTLKKVKSQIKKTGH
ncbi:MAG: cyclic nucleotide-binding domain-containing protein [Nitrospirae bacterium]|nr:cyclic nucleotide-binding domain-containing protein [Nitrospirota bacterium]